MDTDEVIKATTEVCGCSLEEIRSPSRKRRLVAARRIIASFLPHMSLRVIGETIGRDHATVLYYVANFADSLKYDLYLRELYGRVREGMLSSPLTGIERDEIL